MPEYMMEQMKEMDYDRDLPSFRSVVAIITLPLVLILVNTTADLILEDGSTLQVILTFIVIHL
ncbi:hypothetical protein [Sinobaca sp. H24]|uniref:GntT/GntP/DsdX family permease n=1 Tax=Sinobaca sp. H24 TaxID=2923376 RepID=UPI0035B2A086